MQIRSKEWLAVSGNSKLRALDLAVILTSALFWAWVALAVFAPTFYFPLEGTIPTAAFQALSLGVAALALGCAALVPSRATALLDSRQYELSMDLGSVLGGLLAIAGSHARLIPLATAGSCLIGVTLPFFMLEWSRIYSRRGARTAAPLISGALALSIMADVAATALEPFARSICIALAPLLIVATIALIQALVAQPSGPAFSLRSLVSGTAMGARDVMVVDDQSSEDGQSRTIRKRTTLLDCPIALLASCALYGIVFGSLVPDEPFGAVETGVAAGFSFATAASCFAVSCLKPKWLRTGIDCFQIMGVAGALAAAVLGALPEDASVFAYALMLAGFLSFLVALWTLAAYFATNNGYRVVPLFALNLAILCVGYVCGLGIVPLASHAGAGDALRIAGTMLLVIATSLLAMAGSLPLNVFGAQNDKALDSGDPALPDLHTNIANSIGRSHNLTERETEVLSLLVSGRSRPRIAEILCVSENTVNSHIQHIYRKLGIHSFQELLDFVYHPDSR